MACSQATDVACSYDQLTYRCVAGAPTRECAGNLSLNRLACIACEFGSKKLIWQDNQCIEVNNSQLSSLLCSHPVNRLTCINISNPSQFCRFLNGKCESANYKI